MFVALINAIVSILGGFIGFFIDALPDSPFSILFGYLNSIDDGYFVILRWLMPLDLCALILGTWVISITSYYLLLVPLRWLKVLGS